MITAGGLWWVFGFLVSASTVKPANEKPASTPAEIQTESARKQSTAVTSTGGQLNLRVGQMKGFDRAFDVSGTGKVDSHINSIIGPNNPTPTYTPVAPTRESVSTLRRRAQELNAGIFEFLAQRQKNAPPSASEEMKDLWNRKETDAFTKTFVEQGETTGRYAKETSAMFAERFAAPMAAIRNELAGLGLKSTALDDFLADDLRLDFEIQTAAEELQKLAEQVKAD
jgi:hypothetical protein